MSQHTTNSEHRKWYDNGHSSLCLLGTHLRAIGFFAPLEQRLPIPQKVLQYTPVQKVERLFVSLLAGGKAVAHTTTTVRVDPALTTAFGLPRCAEPSVMADTLDAVTEAEVTALRDALAEILQRYGQAPRHDFQQSVWVLDGDLSPLPASAHAEGSERGDRGRCRSKTGRKRVRVHRREPGDPARSHPAGRALHTQGERLRGLDGEEETGQAKRARTEIRLDSGWGVRKLSAGCWTAAIR